MVSLILYRATLDYSKIAEPVFKTGRVLCERSGTSDTKPLGGHRHLWVSANVNFFLSYLLSGRPQTY